MNVPCRAHTWAHENLPFCLLFSCLSPFLSFSFTYCAVLVVMQKAHQAFVCISWQNEHFMAAERGKSWGKPGKTGESEPGELGNGFSTNMHVGTFLHRIALKCRKWHTGLALGIGVEGKNSRTAPGKPRKCDHSWTRARWALIGTSWKSGNRIY